MLIVPECVVAAANGDDWVLGVPEDDRTGGPKDARALDFRGLAESANKIQKGGENIIGAKNECDALKI